ncbi:unnamed protein product [Gulo gulo]|uniref:Uncharacterized protein n=1 Tax=Gulo gulo TaxID=48420 RepID=A0A9X9LF97_GULGU|nr:unnamed protein product [Gulo gulo]
MKAGGRTRRWSREALFQLGTSLASGWHAHCFSEESACHVQDVPETAFIHICFAIVELEPQRAFPPGYHEFCQTKNILCSD